MTLLAAACSLTLFAFQGLPAEKPNSEQVPDTPSTDSGTTQNELQQRIAELGDADPYKRQSAAIALGNMGDPAAVDALVKALNDEDVFVRDFSARALGNLGNARAVDPLIKALNDDDFLVRRSALESLGNLKDPKAAAPLIRALGDDNVLIRRSAAEALGKLGDPKAVDPLVGLLADDDNYLANGAVAALIRIGKPSIPKVTGLLDDWDLGPLVAEILDSLNWQPSSDKQSVWLDVARRKKQDLLKNWTASRKVLLSEAAEGKGRQVESAVCALIGIGNDDVLNDLVKILDARGDSEIAEVFLNSGNETLSEAARQWSAKHGSALKETDQEELRPVIQWGGMTSS